MSTAIPSPSSLPVIPSTSTSSTLASSPSTQSTTTRNPISLRLWKVLGNTSFDDPASREALEIVSERYCASGSLSGLVGRSELDGTTNGLEAEAGPSTSKRRRTLAGRPSAFTTSNKVKSRGDEDNGKASMIARKGLRRDLDKSMAEGSGRFVEAFGKVDEKLQSLSSHLLLMQSHLSSTLLTLSQTTTHTTHLLSRSTTLTTTQKNLELEGLLVDLFIEGFLIGEEERRVVESRGMEGLGVGVEWRENENEEGDGNESGDEDELERQDQEDDVEDINGNRIKKESRNGKKKVMGNLFEVMDKVERVRRDCRSLFVFGLQEGVDGGEVTAGPRMSEDVGATLTGEGEDEERGKQSGGQKSIGTEIMSLTSHLLTTSYHKLHRYLVFEFRKFTKDASLEVSGTMRMAIEKLRGSGRGEGEGEGWGLLQDALDVLNSTRQTAILQSFLDALTRGGPNGLPRPIELHAHDPTRYVGDMLAFVHQSTAGEREFLDALFDVKSGIRRMVGQERVVRGDGEKEEEEEGLARKCLDKHLEGLARPLKARIQHTVKSQEAIIMAYKITNLVQFYLVTMNRTIGPEAHLSKTLKEIHEVANAAFLETLEAQGRSLLRFLHPPDANLSPPLALRESSFALHEIMSVYDTSLVEESDRETDFARILDAAVEPLLEMCRRMVGMRQKGTEWEKHIFLINCFLYLHHVLETYAFTLPRREIMDTETQRHISDLIDEHSDLLLGESGLAPLTQAIASRDADMPLSRTPTAEPKAVTLAMKAFETFLQNLNMLSSPRLALLSSTRLATDIHRGGLERLGSAYAKIHGAVMDKGNKYEFASTLLPRGVDEVATLLGVEMAYN